MLAKSKESRITLTLTPPPKKKNNPLKNMAKKLQQKFPHKITFIHEGKFLLACYFKITSRSYFQYCVLIFEFRATFWRMKQPSRSCLRLKSCLRRFQPNRRLLYRQRRTLMRRGMATDLWLSIPPFCSFVSLTWPTLSLCTSTHLPGLSTCIYR